MHMKKISTLKKKIALLLALLMGLSAVPAAIAVSQDWAMLTITLEWNDQDGVSQTVSANPVYDAPGSFWAYLPAPVSPGTVMLKAYCDIRNGLTISKPNHTAKMFIRCLSERGLYSISFLKHMTS